MKLLATILILPVAALAVTVEPLPQSEYADTEVSTNIGFVVERAMMTRVEFTGVHSMSMGRFIPDPTTQRYELTNDGTFTIKKFHFNALRAVDGETSIWRDR